MIIITCTDVLWLHWVGVKAPLSSLHVYLHVLYHVPWVGVWRRHSADQKTSCADCYRFSPKLWCMITLYIGVMQVDIRAPPSCHLHNHLCIITVMTSAIIGDFTKLFIVMHTLMVCLCVWGGGVGGWLAGWGCVYTSMGACGCMQAPMHNSRLN